MRLGPHPARLAPFRPEQAVQEGGGRSRHASASSARPTRPTTVPAPAPPKLRTSPRLRFGCRKMETPSAAVMAATGMAKARRVGAASRVVRCACREPSVGQPACATPPPTPSTQEQHHRCIRSTKRTRTSWPGPAPSRWTPRTCCGPGTPAAPSPCRRGRRPEGQARPCLPDADEVLECPVWRVGTNRDAVAEASISRDEVEAPYGVRHIPQVQLDRRGAVGDHAEDVDIGPPSRRKRGRSCPPPPDC
jgi:hypothetical protein